MHNAPILQREAAVSAYGLDGKGYRIGPNTLALNAWNLFMIGSVLRILTLVLLVLVNRDKQNKQPFIKLKGCKKCRMPDRRKRQAQIILRERANTAKPTKSKNRYSEISFQVRTRTPAMRELMRIHTSVDLRRTKPPATKSVELTDLSKESGV